MQSFSWVWIPHRTWKWWFGRLFSFSRGVFSGSMLIFGCVCNLGRSIATIYSKTQIRGLNFSRSGCFRQDFCAKHVGFDVTNSWSLTGFAWKSAFGKGDSDLGQGNRGPPNHFPYEVLQPIHQQGILGNITHKYLEPKWPLFLKVNPTKHGLFQPKQGSFEFQVPILKKGLCLGISNFRGYFGIEVHQNYPLDMLKNMGIGSFINFPQMFHQESNGTLRTPR